MTDRESTDRLKGIPIQYIRYLAAFFAAMVALIHLLHPRLGVPRLIQHVQVGILADPRPLLFTISGIAIIVGIALVRSRTLVKAVYGLGVLLMVAYIGGYVAWHTVLDHGAFWPHIHGHGHAGIGFVESLLLHATGDTIGLVSKFYEVLLLTLLAILLKYDPIVLSNE